ncbi:hypothetical protein ASD38_21845 [Caulobacter sp. Root487D2Y]|uniref:hypothetical protein n=1 Tax=Caulobacter sp. Root487D2Y TaxID=1736547 RepID=UPI0006FA1D01|nr:hypothetical protein [Caulobacter sp. Root487D2Y]KQY34384.1 hypothetical protein ASD38_21845 [Caulobacter sp. Root487D2Y]
MQQQFSATDAALSGFRLVREHLKTVGVWAVLMTIASLIVSIATIKLAGPQMAAMMELSAEPSTDPQATLKAMEGMGPLFLFSALYSLVIYSILLAGVNRLVLRPHDSAGAHLRLGADELRQAAVLVLVNLILLAAYFGLVIVAGVGIGIAVAVGGSAAGVLLGLLLGLGVLAAMIFLAVRLSFAGALTFDTGKVSIRDSWALTKGRFWPLLGSYFVAMVLAFVVYALLLVIIAVIGATLGGGISAMADAFNPDMSSLATFFTPAGIVRTLFSGTLSILVLLIVFAPAPTIYAQLRGRDVSETFG